MLSFSWALVSIAVLGRVQEVSLHSAVGVSKAAGFFDSHWRLL